MGFGEKKKEPLNFSVGRLTIQEGTVSFSAPQLETDFTAQVTERPIPGSRALVLHGSGLIRNGHAELKLRGDSLAAFLEPGHSFGLEGCFTWGYTHGRLGGIVESPLTFQGANFEFEMTGPSPAVLFPITRVKLPDLPRYQIQAHIIQQEKKWIIQNIQGIVGGSDFSGEVFFEEMEKKSRLVGRLKSNQLALIDIGIGQDQPPENTSTPLEPIEIDVNLEFQGHRVITPLILEEVRTLLRVKEGQLYLDSLNFGLTGGQVHAMVKLDTHYSPMPTTLDARFQRLDLNRLLAPLGIKQQDSGTLSGQAQFTSGGGSLTDILSSAEGSAFFVVTRAQLNSLLLALARLDLAKTLNSLLFIDNSVEVRCAVAQVRAHQGILSITPVVIDSTSTKVTGGGTVDLRRNHLDLTFEPHPKDLSLFSAYSPFHVTGSLQSPEVRPKVGPLGGRMAAAAALAALVGPVGAVMPFIEPGIGDDNDCQDLVRDTAIPFEDKR
ncbi:AsmA family protein [Gammaproteobacteria bacterium]